MRTVRAMRAMRATFTAAVFLALASGCALLSKSDPLTPRYFSPEPAASAGDDSASARPVKAGGSAPELRLGRVTAASYLGERLVYRTSSYELGFYEDRRWTERPDEYFRRSLSRALFESGGARRIVSGSGPTLDVELVEFAELKAPSHVARVQAIYALYDPRAVRTEATVTIELPIRTVSADREAAEAVRSLSEALSSVVNRIVERVQANLETPAVDTSSTNAR